MAKTEYHNGAPHYNLVSSELWYQNAPSDKPIAEYAKDQGFDMHLRFVDQTEAAALEKTTNKKSGSEWQSVSQQPLEQSSYSEFSATLGLPL